MTRAKDHLRLIVPQRFYAHQQRSGGDRHMYTLRTRFIPDAITDHFEQCAWPAPIRESSSPAVAPLKTVPIRRRSHQRRSGVDPAAVCGRVRGNFLNEARNVSSTPPRSADTATATAASRRRGQSKNWTPATSCATTTGNSSLTSISRMSPAGDQRPS